MVVKFLLQSSLFTGLATTIMADSDGVTGIRLSGVLFFLDIVVIVGQYVSMRTTRQGSGRRVASISRRGFPAGHLDGRRLAFEQLEDRRLLSVQQVGIEAFSGDPQVDFSPIVSFQAINGQTVQGVRFDWQSAGGDAFLYPGAGVGVPLIFGDAILGEGLGNLTLTFGGSFTHLGFDFARDHPNVGSGTVTLLDEFGNSVGFSSFSANRHQGNFSYGFEGFESSIPFTRARIRFNTPGSPDDIGELFFLDNIRFGPDIEVAEVEWNSNLGGIDISYEVIGTPLTADTTVEVYWATGTDLGDRIDPNNPVHTVVIDTVAEKSTGIHDRINVPGAVLRGAPPGTTHILVVADSQDIYSQSKEPDSLALLDTRLSYVGRTANSAAVSEYSTRVLKDLLRFSGEDIGVVTSTGRLAEDQARIMYDNLEKGKGRNYAPPGAQVEAVYDALKQQGKSRTEIEMAMVAEINTFNPLSLVSRHLGNLAVENVIDIAPSSLKNQPLFRQAAFAAKADGRISKIEDPINKRDPAWHLVIPQLSPLLNPLPVASNLQAFTASGTVSTGHALFNFQGVTNTTATISVLVTDIFPGTTYTDDDTELFLFDSTGRLLASNDDPPPEDTFFQSLISDFAIPETGMYTVAVTTYDNDPLLDVNGVLVGWEDDGESSVAFNVEVTQLLPADFSRNGSVGGEDFLIWQQNVGTSSGATIYDGDANEDEQVNGEDLGLWESWYGTTVPAAVVELSSVGSQLSAGSIDTVPVSAQSAAAESSVASVLPVGQVLKMFSRLGGLGLHLGGEASTALEHLPTAYSSAEDLDRVLSEPWSPEFYAEDDLADDITHHATSVRPPAGDSATDKVFTLLQEDELAAGLLPLL